MLRSAVLLFALLVACDSNTPRFHARGGAHAPATEVAVAVAVEAPPPPVPASDFAPAAEPSRDGWNTTQIDWQPHDTALARARSESRPVLVAVSATWCSHCRNYAHVFEDARIVERARRFFMVHVDSDVERAAAARYVADGGYVPRTYFLAPDGTPMADVLATNPRFRHFFDESNPASLLAAMDAALAHVGG